MNDTAGDRDGGGYPRARRLPELTRGDVFTLGVAFGLLIAAALRWVYP